MRLCLVAFVLVGGTAAYADDHANESMAGCKVGLQGNPLPARDLVQAVACLDLPAAKQLVSAKNVNAVDDRGMTPLERAIDAHDVYHHADHNPEILAMVKLLLGRGADARHAFAYGGVQGYTPLHYAAYDGRLELVKVLVEAGADVRATDSRGYTPLHQAAVCDFRLSGDDRAKETILYLVAHGADPNARGKDGVTPIGRLPEACNGEPCSCKETYRLLRELGHH